MKAAESTLSEILSSTKVYEIPEYQRAYSWKHEHVTALLEDLYDAFENNIPEYFMGSIIVIEKANETIFEVVDGQQRLTSLNLVFAKIRDLMTDPVQRNDVQKIILPVNNFKKEKSGKPRLVVREKDRLFFENFVVKGISDFGTKALSETQLRMKNNLKTIEDFLFKKSQDELCGFVDYLLENVCLVFVKTENFDSAYRLFNVLNARGLSLSNGDLLKNKLFQKAQSDDEKENITNSWSELENLVGLEKLDVFLSHHRTSIKGDKQQFNLFKEYENILNEFQGTVSDFCNELSKSAANYHKITSKNNFSGNIECLMISLKDVSHDEWIPALLALMNKNNVENSAFFSEFLLLLEKITMQNWVRRLGKTKRNTVYYRAIKDINSGKSNNDIIYTIKAEADNEDFMTLLASDIYGMGYDAAILLRIEREMQDDSVFKTFNGVISVEHILPQKIKDVVYWEERFTPEQQKLWVHKLGNLTLLSGRKNSAAQNYSFDKKKEVYLKRGKKVSFDMTKQICDETDWTIEILEKRQKELLEKAAEIWNI
jgi:uncharacterized protein with ParB-like and HNH nuclease domain